MNAINLQNREDAVTGGARGIGQGLAKRLLASGATVCLWDIDANALASAVQALSPLGKVEPVMANVADPASVDAATREAVSRLGGVFDLAGGRATY